MAIEERLGQSSISRSYKRQVKKNAPKNNFAYGQNDDDDDETDDDDYKDLYELKGPSGKRCRKDSHNPQKQGA